MKQTDKKLPKWLENKVELVILLLGWVIIVGGPVTLAGKTVKDAEKLESVRQNVINRNAVYNDTINQRVR